MGCIEEILMEIRTLAVVTAGLILAAGNAICQTSTAAPGAAGHWEGKIQIPDHEMTFTVDLARNAKGAWIGSMSIVGIPGSDLPLSDIAIEGASVKFSATVPNKAMFNAKMSDDNKSMSGKAAGPGGEVPFELSRKGEANVKIPAPSSALTKEMEGNWEGALNTPGGVLHVTMKLSATPDGTASATLVSVDQGNTEIPVASVTIKEKDIRLEIPAVAGSYKGTLGANGEIAGEFTQGGNPLPLTFKRPASK